MEAVGSRLAERHGTARCDEETSFPGTVEKLSTEIQRLTDALRRNEGEPSWLPEVERLLTDFVLRHADRLRARVLAGRVLAVHGHLSASRISVSDDGARVRLSDPLRSPFGPAYGDAVRDVVDLHGELQAAGLRRHADRLVAAYAEAALDFRLYGVFDFHARLQALRRRRTDPGTWAELASRSERLWEPTTELGGVDHYLIDTSRDVGETRRRVEDLLEGLWHDPCLRPRNGRG